MDGRHAHFEPWGPTRLICRLTILGVTKEATGEGESTDPNCGTIAEAQAFKRTCSAFGCGRYLYDLPQIWVDLFAPDPWQNAYSGLRQAQAWLMGHKPRAISR